MSQEYDYGTAPATPFLDIPCEPKEPVHQGNEDAVGSDVAPSQFFDGTSLQFAWDATSIEAFRRCPRYYEYTILKGYRYRSTTASGAPGNVHLRFGSEFHTAVQDYDKVRAQGIGHNDALFDVVAATYDRIEDFESEDPNKNRLTLMRTIVWYLDKYADDPCKTYILADGKPAVELSFRFNAGFGPPEGLGQGDYMLCGHLDRVVDWNGDLYVMDYKTTKSAIGERFFDAYQPNTQMSLYSLAAKILLDTPIKGVIINGLQVMVNFTRIVRGMTYRSEADLDEWLQDYGYTMTAAERYAEDNYWPMNDSGCDKYGGCVFRQVCSAAPHIREAILEQKFVKDPWNPLKVR